MASYREIDAPTASVLASNFGMVLNPRKKMRTRVFENLARDARPMVYDEKERMAVILGF